MGSIDGAERQQRQGAGMRRGFGIFLGAALIGVIGAAFLMVSREDEAVARGRIVYDENCASCHGANLEGQPDWQSPASDGRYPAPPHDATGHTWHHSDAELIAYITLGGEEALAQIGVSFSSGMPGFGEILTPQDVEDILAYLKSRWSERERAFQAERTLADDR